MFIGRASITKRKSVRKSLIIAFSLLFSLAAIAGKPKIGRGFGPRIGVNERNETGGNTKTEVTLPVGLPVAGEESDVITSEDPNVSSNIVYTFDLNDDAGTSSVNQTHSAFEKAKNMNAACVLIRINSFEGGWDVAENIRQEIISYDRPVMVYVNNRAIPSASFISSGADSIYTKKGSTLSNKKSSPHKKAKPSSVTQKKNSSSAVVSTSKENSDAEELYSSDATMSEILYKAGLSNLTVVEHKAGFSERAIDILMNPWMAMAVLLLVGFVMRRTVKGKLPGPLLYALAVMVLLYLAPFQLSGLANSVEIIASIALIVAVIVSARYNQKMLTGIFLIALTFMFALVRAGDTDVLLRYSSFSELVTLPSIPLGLVILGWWIGKIGEAKTARTSKVSDVNIATLANAA